MLRTERIRECKGAAFESFWALYEEAFPLEERRSLLQQMCAMAAEPDFVCLRLDDEVGFVGILTYWEQPDFVFAEHLAIAASRRGQGLGHTLMESLHAQAAGRPIILEIELPVDVVTQARARFYESCGYHPLPQPHEQLPFHPGHAPVPMQLLGWPLAVTPATVDDFEAYVQSHVMQYRDC